MATQARCGRSLSSWKSKFPPMRWANDVKFDQRHVDRSNKSKKGLLLEIKNTQNHETWRLGLIESLHMQH